MSTCILKLYLLVYIQLISFIELNNYPVIGCNKLSKQGYPLSLLLVNFVTWSSVNKNICFCYPVLLSHQGLVTTDQYILALSHKRWCKSVTSVRPFYTQKNQSSCVIGENFGFISSIIFIFLNIIVKLSVLIITLPQKINNLHIFSKPVQARRLGRLQGGAVPPPGLGPVCNLVHGRVKEGF